MATFPLEWIKQMLTFKMFRSEMLSISVIILNIKEKITCSVFAKGVQNLEDYALFPNKFL